MKEISLTQGQFAIVNDEDYERLNQHKWYAHWDGWNWYAIRNSRAINGKSVTVHMHREVMTAPKGVQVDHQNGNGLDNRKENLRLCTNQQNGFNRKNSQKNNRLGIKGIHFDEKRKKFVARLVINGKAKLNKRFSSLQIAQRTYAEAKEEYFGEFARKL